MQKWYLFYSGFHWSLLGSTTQETLLKARCVFLRSHEPLGFTGSPLCLLLRSLRGKQKLAENKIITDGVEEEMEKWQVEEGDKHMHRGTQQDCWGLNRTRRFRRHRRLWKSKHSTWFCRWSKNPRVKPAVFVSCSHYPPGEWGATKTLLPPHPTYAVLSMSRELTDSDWQLVLFWFWCAFIFLFFFASAGWVCGFIPFFHIMPQWCFLLKHSVARGCKVDMCVWCIHS